MNDSDEKYRQIITLLKNSKPKVRDGKDIEREIMTRISSMSKRKQADFTVFDLLFGWTEIVWIRRSLITVSAMLVILFVYQQSLIVKQINWLSGQIVTNNGEMVRSSLSEYSGRIKLLKISGSRIQDEKNTISTEQLDLLLESLEKLRTDYDNLMKIINENPELKELVDKKMNEAEYEKIKL